MWKYTTQEPDVPLLSGSDVFCIFALMLSLKKVLFFINTRGLVWLTGLLIMPSLLVTARSETEKVDEAFGEASYYSQRFVGKRTTSGEPYDDKDFTAAHPRYPFGTYLLVTNSRSQQSVVVRVNDRFRPRRGHLIDVSMAAAVKIDLVRLGRARVSIRVLDPEEAMAVMQASGQLAAMAFRDSISMPLPVPEPLPLPVSFSTLLVNPTDVYFHDVNR